MTATSFWKSLPTRGGVNRFDRRGRDLERCDFGLRRGMKKVDYGGTTGNTRLGRRDASRREEV